MRFKLGLKVWSTNLSLVEESVRLGREGTLDYIEVFSVPDSCADTASKWATIGVPFVVHAPHSLSGLNFADPEASNRNAKLAEESLRMADILRADKVVFHPGTRGTATEMIRQVRALRDERMLIENKPWLGLDGSTCVGATPREMSEILTALDLGFCLDFGHAIAAANSTHTDPHEYFSSFLALSPCLFHLTDGDWKGEVDRHERYGGGSFPLTTIVGLVPDGAMVTDEARREKKDVLDEYLADRAFIESLGKGGQV